MGRGVLRSARKLMVLSTGAGGRQPVRKRVSPMAVPTVAGFTRAERRVTFPPMVWKPWVHRRMLKPTADTAPKMAASLPSTDITRGRPIKPLLP